MNLHAKQKQTHRHRKQTYGHQRGEGVGEGQIRTMGLTDTKYYTYNRRAKKIYCIAQGIITNIF